ncbi:MAG: MBL fold metallo-hydrolase [Lawsonibacter sp.]
MSHLKLIPLASSSHGNAYLVEDGTTCLLIECGVSWKKLQKLTGFGVSGIAGCLISHEHKDHAGRCEQPDPERGSGLRQPWDSGSTWVRTVGTAGGP